VRIAYLDCVGGVSGDMFLGALLDAGWPEERLRASVAWLGAEIAELRVETRMRSGFRGVGIVVEPAAGREPGHRGLPEILALLAAAPLAPEVRGRAEAVFRRLAEAEAHAHGSSPAEVHFHEVGAVDSLVDIVGVAAALADLEVDRLFFSPLPLGSGRVPAAHGPIPLPAPATALLVQGIPVEFTGREGERTTPTGAALVTTLGRCCAPPPMVLERVGIGAGSYSYPDRPNLTRLFLGREAARIGRGARARSEGAEGSTLRGPNGCEGGGAEGEGYLLFSETPSWGWGPGARQAEGEGESCPGFWSRVAVLETQIDDASAEEIGYLCDRLRTAGAFEVFTEAIQMKKGRPGCRLTVLCAPEGEAAIATRMLLDSPTLGVRRRLEWRRELRRRCIEVDTPFGPVRVKLALRGRGWTAKPEYDSCRAAAEASGARFPDVVAAALAAAARAKPHSGGPSTDAVGP